LEANPGFDQQSFQAEIQEVVHPGHLSIENVKNAFVWKLDKDAKKITHKKSFPNDPVTNEVVLMPPQKVRSFRVKYNVQAKKK